MGWFYRVIEVADWLSVMWQSTELKEIDRMAGELYSGAGTILGQGSKTENREREKKFFAEIGVFLSQKQAFSEKKSSSPIWSVFLSQKQAFSKNKKGLRRIWSVFLSQKQAFSKKKVFVGLEAFFVPKMAQDTSLRGAKAAQGGHNISRISPGQLPPLPPYFPRLWSCIDGDRVLLYRKMAIELALSWETLTNGKFVKNRRILSGDIELVKKRLIRF